MKLAARATSLRRLASHGISRDEAIQLGGRISSSGLNAMFVFGDAGFERVCVLLNVPGQMLGPDPKPRQQFSDDEKAIIAQMDDAQKKSEGLGDTLKHAIDALGLDRAAKLFERITGKTCGCNKRRDWLNKWWPYKRG